MSAPKTPAEVKREVRTIRRMRGRCTERNDVVDNGMAKCGYHLERARERARRHREKKVEAR